MKTEILKTIVGSYAHGLAKPDSDIDYRGVYVDPTSEILRIGHTYKGSSWVEGDDQDNTSYEIGHFLMLALKNNPSILEVFLAPIKEATTHGHMLRELFPFVYDPQQAYNAFVGYSLNQRKKLLDNHLGRRNKYATAYIRTLYNLIELLDKGIFSVKIEEQDKLIILKQLKYGEFHTGFVIDKSDELIKQAQELLPKATSKYNPDEVNKFLLDMRKRYW
jgi:hypothetical protein